MSHQAALYHKAGSPLEVTPRPTPTPGPNEVLIKVHSIALNPIDHYQRDYGMPPITHSPGILGSDIAGTIVSHGSGVSSSSPKSGTRVLAYAPSFFYQGKPNYGAFQKFVLVPEQNVCPLPDSVSFNAGSGLPMAVQTAWTGFIYQTGVSRDAKFKLEDKKGLLVWGAASSVGLAAVQIGRLTGFTVYATAGEKNHGMVKKLGASKVFDYKKDDVVQSIVKAAKEEGLSLNVAYLGAGDVAKCAEVLSQFKVDEVARLASAPLVPEDFKPVEGVKVEFVRGSEVLEERLGHFGWIFGVWLKEKLASGEYVPSHEVKVVEGGLDGLNKGMDELKKGVSGVKLVVEI